MLRQFQRFWIERQRENPEQQLQRSLVGGVRTPGATSFPHRRVENRLARYGAVRPSFARAHQRARGSKPYLERRIIKRLQQSRDRTRRPAATEQLRKPASDDGIGTRVNQGIDHLTGRGVDDAAERADRRRGHVIPGEQRYDMRHEVTVEAVFRAQYLSDRKSVV